MIHVTIFFPILLYVYNKLKESAWTNQYTARCFCQLGCTEPINLLMTLMVIHIVGFEYLSHYQAEFGSCKQMMAPLCDIFSIVKLREILGGIYMGMPTWKLLLLQRRMVQEYGPSLCEDGHLKTLFIDWTDLDSFSEQREGSECGHHKKYKGKPCYKLLLSLLGRIFIDCKLCPGKSAPKIYFQKLVKRAIAAGYRFEAVCADAAFGCVENVLFLTKLSLHYALGASKKLGIVAQSVELFKKLSHQGSSRIIGIKKGLAAFDAGWFCVGEIAGNPIYVRLIICRRIHRRKKDGHRNTRYYYYSILTDLEWSVNKIVKYYHTRQNIENGIKELKYHYALNRMVHRNLKANEFYIASKLFAMTMVKLFAYQYLPRSLCSLWRKTLIRQVFANTILNVKILAYSQVRFKVELKRKGKYLWHWKRILKKLFGAKLDLEALKLAA